MAAEADHLGAVEQFITQQLQALHAYVDDLHTAWHNELAQAKQAIRADIAAGKVPAIFEQPAPIGGGLVADGPTPGVGDPAAGGVPDAGSSGDSSSTVTSSDSGSSKSSS